METLTQFLDRQSKRINGQKAAAAEIVLQSVTVPPDEAASDMQIASNYAKATGAPAPPLPMVQEHRSIFEAAIERQKNATFLRSSPKLSEWLRRPENAQIARDDVEGLSWFEGFGRGTANTLSRAGQRIGQGYNQARFEQTSARARDRGRSFGEILDDERTVLGEGPGAVKAWPNLSDVGGAFARYVDAQYADLIGTDDEASARQFLDAVNADVEAIRATPKSDVAIEAERTAFVDGASLGETLSNIGQTAISNPVGLLSWVMETAGESAPQLAAAIGVTAATRNPMAGVAVGTGGSYATERFNAPADFFEEKGINLADPGAAARVMSDPALIQEAAERGVIRGLVVSAFDGLSLGLAGRSFSRSPFVEGIAQVVQQAFSGAAGEYAARQAAGQATDWNDIVAESLAGLATAPADMLAAGRGLPRDRQRAAAAGEGAARIGAVTEAASTSKTRQRSPDAFRDFVARAAAGGNAETMYVPAQEFVRYFQDMGLDPYEIARGMEGVDFAAIDAEADAGGDIAIPTATYVARIAGSEHDRFFAENARFDPEGMSEAEARAFNDRAADALDEAWQEAEALRQEDEQYRSFEVEIFDTMVSRLRQAGRATDVATTEATLYPAFYRTMAERSGQTLDEFLRLYPLPQVRGDVPQGMQMRDVDALSRTLAEARSQRAVKADSRQSLLEWISDRGGINDPGGELRARDAAVVKRGRGRKNLRLERTEGGQDLTGARFGADEVAQAAIEAGFLADTPIAAEYRAALAEGREVPDITPALWEAIDEELRGNRQFAEAKAGDVERSEEVGEVEAYLAGLGVSLDDDDATIRAAVERDQAERASVPAGPRFRQPDDARTLRGLVAFARTAARGITRKLAIGRVGPGLVDLLRREAGIDVAGFSHDIDANAVQHILKNHSDAGRESARGQIAVTDDDIASIPAILAAPDRVVTGAKNKRGQDLVGYIKAMPDGTVLFLEEVRTGRRTLSAVTMRKYPATSDYPGIAKTIGPNVRNDGGDGLKIAPVPRDAKTLFQEARGAITLPAGGIGRGQTVIDLFRSANLSTVVHESGHFFLAVTQDLAARGEAGAASDMEALRGWWRSNAGDVARDASRAGGAEVTAADVEAAIDAGTTGDAAKDAAIDVGTQEQFARAFEAYLMEGKAPSVALRPVFERFRAWLTAIYRRLRGLDVTVSPEVRVVFDRLLATDAEIREAEAESGGHDLVFATAEQMGLDEAQFAALLKLRDQAKADAAASLLRDTMEPLKREREAWFREEKARVRTEVEAEVNGYRQYRAFEWMANRRWLGGETPEGFADMRMDKAMLVQRYGEGVLSTLPRGQFTVYAVEGGVDPDYAAAVFGFDTGDELVRMLERSPPRAEAIRADQAALDQQQSSFMFPTTGSGFTKARVQGYHTPLALDLTLLPAHMDKVLRFTHLEPAIRQTAAIVSQREMRSALEAFDPNIVPSIVMPWLQRTAQQAIESRPTTPPGRVLAKLSRELRRRVGVGTMFLNVVNAAQQITGFSTAAVLVRPTRLKAALVRFSKGDAERMRAEAVAASAFMRDRIDDGGRLLQQRIQDAVVKPTAAGEIRAWVDRHGYVLQAAAQNLIDVVTWHAAYDQAIGKGLDDAAAVFEADSVIRRTMGDFAPENVSLFETGTAVERLFTMFYSYFNMNLNLVGGEMRTAMRTLGWGGAPRMFWIYAFGIAIPSIVGEMIVQAGKGELGDEEDDGYLDDVASLFFGSQARYVAGMVPIAGQGSTALLNLMNDEPYDDRLSTSPIVPALERVARAPVSVSSAVFGEGSSRRAVMDGVGALGTIFGIPTGQLAKTLGYVTGVAEDYSEPEGAVDVARGLVSGRDGSER